MQAIESLPQTEPAVSTETAALAKRPWQTPTCTKFTAEELTEQVGRPIFWDGITTQGS